ncbi:MAG: tRNA threonylcarbamoyladenosine dehydratase [Thiohalocapsa sp.]|uniref:tRNA threonylcarbamoyladenosine dehydratase n=1 Tax=Thiohalocapsa sp. TaxID=2497641 RepID=UPI0025CF8B19|nr:tRNA threonylcarbamoyladenosine dehydratase [Thiohalocapsa sp.]MCG6942584.1 tRNA threonylcarbamoyladenosine dehydratase [Thiohalocapsa sp.]
MNADNPIWERTAILIGAEGCARLAESHVLLAGLGGVGSFTAEALARSGVGRLTIADFDVVAPSNLNRQLCALGSTLGARKADVITARIADINPRCAVQIHTDFLAPGDMPALVGEGGYDHVADAIDSLGSKVALLAAALDAGVPVAASMGAGGRLDPTRIRVSDLMDTRECRLAREVRRLLRRAGHERGVLAVWSDEPSLPPLPPEPTGRGRDRAVNGTISYMPALFGLTLAGVVVRRLLAGNAAAR